MAAFAESLRQLAMLAGRTVAEDDIEVVIDLTTPEGVSVSLSFAEEILDGVVLKASQTLFPEPPDVDVEIRLVGTLTASRRRIPRQEDDSSVSLQEPIHRNMTTVDDQRDRSAADTRARFLLGEISVDEYMAEMDFHRSTWDDIEADVVDGLARYAQAQRATAQSS